MYLLSVTFVRKSPIHHVQAQKAKQPKQPCKVALDAPPREYATLQISPTDINNIRR